MLWTASLPSTKTNRNESVTQKRSMQCGLRTAGFFYMTKRTTTLSPLMLYTRGKIPTHSNTISLMYMYNVTYIPIQWCIITGNELTKNMLILCEWLLESYASIICLYMRSLMCVGNSVLWHVNIRFQLSNRNVSQLHTVPQSRKMFAQRRQRWRLIL